MHLTGHEKRGTIYTTVEQKNVMVVIDILPTMEGMMNFKTLAEQWRCGTPGDIRLDIFGPHG